MQRLSQKIHPEHILYSDQKIMLLFLFSQLVSSTTASLLPQLLSLLAGLVFISESDAPLEVVSCHRPAGTLPNHALLEMLGESPSAAVQVVELSYFLRTHTALKGAPEQHEIAVRYRALQDFMTQQLRQVQVYRVGSEPRLHAYALGETADQQLVGFKTVLIET